MKYRFLLLLVILGILCCNLYGKGWHCDSIKNYYYFKNKAELGIIDSNYQKALSLYKEAFSFKMPNGRDLYNAFILSYLKQDSAFAKYTFESMVIHGQKKEMFEKLYFGEKISKTAFYNWISSSYDSLNLIAEKSACNRLAKIVDTIYFADQSSRIQNPNLDQLEIEVLIKNDLLNMEHMKQFVSKHGFPGYHKVGIFESSMEGWLHANSTFWILMWHTRQISKGLNEIALRAVKEGDFPPDDFATLIDKQNKVPIYYEIFEKNTAVGGAALFIALSEKEEKKIDLLRSDIYLEPLSEYRRKLYFSQKGGNPFYIVPPFTLALNFMPFELEK